MDLYGMYTGATEYGDGFDEVTIIWEGALESVTYWQHAGGHLGDMQANFDRWLNALEADANESGACVEVYILNHGHALDIGDAECVCAQYETSCRPDFAYNAAA